MNWYLKDKRNRRGLSKRFYNIEGVSRRMRQTDTMGKCHQDVLVSRGFNRLIASVWDIQDQVHLMSEISRFNNYWTNRQNDLKFWRFLTLYYRLPSIFLKSNNWDLIHNEDLRLAPLYKMNQEINIPLCMKFYNLMNFEILGEFISILAFIIYRMEFRYIQEMYSKS